MSDPVTQAEIEDVLSSIRRLVSEDGRSAPRQVAVSAARGEAREQGQPAPAASVQKSDQPKPTSRLVLTPALRVTEDPLETTDVEADQSISTELSESSADLAAAEIDADSQRDAPIDFDVEPELDPAEVVALHPHDTAHDADEDQAVDDSDEVAVPQGDSEQAAAPLEQEEAAPWADPEATLFGAVEPALLPSGEEVSDLTTQVGETVARQEQDVAAPAAEQDVAAPAAEQDVELDGSQRVSAVVQKIAELEAKVARSSGQWEPDGASRDPYAGTNIETLEWQDHYDAGDHEADVDEAPISPDQDMSDAGFAAETLAEEAATEAALEALDAGGSEESYLDEDSLRELVADIVRSELQGALGERITRNVRKLVRREIQRALAAQDLI
ncbi:MAG: hypothetical protein BM558_01035 [Roseobacter sp. MedPE-SW]|nr:MAG: hypothetical protein BM558_01035 [Roseobacter sp. MedPE-SW]